MRLLVLFPLLLFISGCFASHAPVMTMQSMQDSSYPCVRVSFPEQVRHEDSFQDVGENEAAVVHKLLMSGGYRIEVSKLYWRSQDVPHYRLSDRIEKNLVMAELPQNSMFPQRSALIYGEVADLPDNKHEARIVGSVLDYAANVAIRIDIKKVIFTAGTFAPGAIPGWKESSIGQRTIENMRTILEAVARDAKVVSCQQQVRPEIRFWD